MGMTITRFLLASLVFLGWLASAHAQKEWDGWDYKFDREIETWTETQAQLPAYPKDENLISLDVGSATPHRFYVDAASVSTSKEGVVRYTMVIRTAGGATNVSFEGIRCESREQKYYAIGRRDKSWVRARNPEWRRVEHKDFTAHHITLYREYFCQGKQMNEPAAKIVSALRSGPARSPAVD